MNLEGVSIYDDGAGIGREGVEKIRQIVRTLKSVAPSSEVSMRFLKSGNQPPMAMAG